MSYSYVKTVFPNFKHSNVYDTKMYENLNTLSDTRIFEPIDMDVSNSYSKVGDVVSFKPSKEGIIETFQDNQRYYNIPLPMENKERFENNDVKAHVEYTKHVLECSSCRELLMKQFNIETERIRNEELMELVSYLIFGLFILLLIDSYVKK